MTDPKGTNEANGRPTGARNATDRLLLVVNPAAGGGRVANRIPALERAAEAAFANWSLRKTEDPGHATILTREALREGFDVVAAVGGDGTCNEVVNGFFEGPDSGDLIRPEATFAVVPLGTGSDLVRSLKIPLDTPGALETVAFGETRTADLMQVRIRNHQGERLTRLCINVTSFGASGDVVRRANASSKRLGGRITFLQATLSTLLSYRPQPVRLTWEDGAEEGSWEGQLLTAFIGNGHYCGGGMWVGRGGTMVDGRLELSVLTPAGIVTSMTNIPNLYRGTLEQIPGVIQSRITRLTADRVVDDGPPTLVEVDGEQLGMLPFEVSVVPCAVRIRGGWSTRTAGSEGVDPAPNGG
jgi:diacylglycerol kinase (ATP)